MSHEDDVKIDVLDVLERLTSFQRAMEDDDDDDDDDAIDDAAPDDMSEDDEEEEEDAVQTGFRFCAEEAIRFLVEEEHFSPTDPIIVELRQHLQHKQMQLQNQQQQQQPDPRLCQQEKRHRVLDEWHRAVSSDRHRQPSPSFDDSASASGTAGTSRGTPQPSQSNESDVHSETEQKCSCDGV